MTLSVQPCDETVIRATPVAAPCDAGRKRWILAATVLGSTLAFIDGAAVNVAMPAIERDLGASLALIQWVINAYTLSLAALLLIGGAAGDQFGRRRIFIAGIVIFALASVWCGLAPNLPQLVAARTVQGIGAALLVPCSLAIIGASFEESERGRAIGTWAGFSALAGAIGPVLGGWIVDQASWRWIFLINPVLAVITVWIAVARVPESRDPEARPEIDWLGGLLAFAGLGLIVFGLVELPDRGIADPWVVVALLAGGLLLAAFVWVEARAPAPMMPLGLFRSRIFSGINLLTLFLYAALGGVFFVLPFLLIGVHGYSATQAGAAFLPFTILMAGLSRWSGGLLDRFGPRLPLIVGPVVTAIGFALLAWPDTTGSFWTTFLLPLLVTGFGMTIAVAPLTTAVINAVPQHQTGVASGINNAVARVAGLLAVALFSALAIGGANRAIDRYLDATVPTAPVVSAVREAKGRLTPDLSAAQLKPEDQQQAMAILRQSMLDGIRQTLGLAALLALLGAGSVALTIRNVPKPDR